LYGYGLLLGRRYLGSWLHAMLIEVEDVLTSDDGLFEHWVNSLALIVFDQDTGKHIGWVERLERCVEIVVHILFDLHFYN
jgi:hypothetical protein